MAPTPEPEADGVRPDWPVPDTALTGACVSGATFKPFEIESPPEFATCTASALLVPEYGPELIGPVGRCPIVLTFVTCGIFDGVLVPGLGGLADTGGIAPAGTCHEANDTRCNEAVATTLVFSPL